MPMSRFNPLLGLLMIVLAIIGIALLISTSANVPNSDAIRMADPQSTGTTVSQATAIPTQVTPLATAGTTVIPTGTPPDPTPPAELTVIVLPSVVAQVTTGWLGPTPDPTQQARVALDDYITNRLYFAPATLVARGPNATPIPDEFYPNLTLTTYEIYEVDFPEEVTWNTWVADAQFGLQRRPMTFDKAWRVVVKGEGFISGNSRWTMFSDDTLLGYCIGASGGMTAIVYDRSLLREGAKLCVGFGGSSITCLRDTLHLPPYP